MKSFSFSDRNHHLACVENEHYDLIIVGGGITGAGTARDAAMRGMKVLLLEAKDFASGTSSRSSKLIHGGIRYLENYEFKLVFEALSERTKLFAMAPHMVHPLRFMLPVYKNSRVSRFVLGMGMWLYDALALFQAPAMHESLDAAETVDRMPAIRAQELVGSFIYSDAYMDDDRLVFETLRSANEHGARSINYAKVTQIHLDEDQQATGLEFEDELEKKKYKVRGKKIVSSVGPWTDIFGEQAFSSARLHWKRLLRPTKGIHLTFPKSRLPLETAVVMAVEKGNRIVFGIPRHEMIIVGTTDTDFQDSPDQVKVLAEDVEYLLKVVNEYFPGGRLTAADILSSYCGVRPLVQDGSASEGKTSREHTIFTHETGVVFVAGGKYTTYRLMAKQIVDEVLMKSSIEEKAKFKPADTSVALNSYCSFDNYSLSQAQSLMWTSDVLTNDEKAELALRFGCEAERLMKERPFYSYWQLEAYYAISRTMCFKLTDFFVRRVPLFLADWEHGLNRIDSVTEVFINELHWSADRAQSEMKEYREYVAASKSWQQGS